ncbi:hypothetical protein QP185_07975 [Sphingomonas aerolata]|uniref:hypothetical protein n=1 Tax=Sphingomonas aerolata TaxID=185951 RepID=UPI002FE0FC55
MHLHVAEALFRDEIVLAAAFARDGIISTPFSIGQAMRSGFHASSERPSNSYDRVGGRTAGGGGGRDGDGRRAVGVVDTPLARRAASACP